MKINKSILFLTSIFIFSSCSNMIVEYIKDNTNDNNKILKDPIYYSKCENWDNIINPDIFDYTTVPEYETIHGAPLFSTPSDGKIGNCIRVTGNSSELGIYFFGKSGKIPDNHVISFWFRFISNDKQYIPIFGDIDHNTNVEYRVLLTNGSLFHCNISVNDNLYVDTANRINDTDWHHIYILIDKAGGLADSMSVKVYLDNLLYMETSEKPDKWDIGYHLRLQNSSGAVRSIDLDNIKIWDYIVSEDPSQEYNAGNGRED